MKAHLVEIYLKLHKKLVFLGIRYSRLFIPGYGLNISDFHIIGLIFHKFIKFKLKVSVFQMWLPNWKNEFINGSKRGWDFILETWFRRTLNISVRSLQIGAGFSLKIRAFGIKNLDRFARNHINVCYWNWDRFNTNCCTKRFRLFKVALNKNLNVWIPITKLIPSFQQDDFNIPANSSKWFCELDWDN